MWLVRVVALAVALSFATPAAAQTSSAEVFGRLPVVDDAAISPDGSKVALARYDPGVSSVRVIDLDTGAAADVRMQDDMRLRRVGWADDRHVSFQVSLTMTQFQAVPPGQRFRGSPDILQYLRWGVFDLTSHRSRLLTTNERAGWLDLGSDLLAPIQGDPGFARMIGRATGIDAEHTVVYRVDLNSGSTTRVPAPGINSDTIDFTLDENGAVMARTDSEENSNRWRIFGYTGGAPNLVLEGVSETGAPAYIEGLMPDGRLATLRWDEAFENETLIAVDRSSGASEVIYSRNAGGIDGAILDPWTRRVVGVSWTAEEATQHFFDADLVSAQTEAQALAHDALLLSWSTDRRRFVVYVEQGLDGGGYYLFARGATALTRLGMRYPGLSDVVAGMARQSITYPARDGVRIPAYLTLPANAEGRRLPLVLLVHGGPRARDTLAFDWWAAFLASRGYAVLQPNFRGSSGYGYAWERAGYRQFGGLMQTDVEDGVASLGRAGIIDPERVCIAGASYGGYSALAGATLTPDRYVCAVSVAGISDLDLMIRQDVLEQGRRSMLADDIIRLIGDRNENRDAIRAVSPANLADRVQIPVLLMHGTQDTVVPVEQSRVMRDRMQRAGKDVRFVELRGDDHYLSDAETRTQMLREMDAFLAANIGAPANQ